jgi:hypothetical protein
VISGVTVVIMLVCFIHLHARLRAHQAPGIPCALYLWAEGFLHDPGASCRGKAELYLDVIARSEATKQSISLFRAMDCFAEPVIGRAFARPVGSQ